MSLNPGQRLSHYVLIEKIGEGGMGVVWKARDESLDREVAIKVLPEGFARDAERLSRFQREAKAVAALSHPNIVSIFGFGTEGEVTYAAIELLQGQTLREHLAAGPLPPRKALDVARQIAAGLDAAHSKGIVHRDLKPDNVFITTDGRPRILDFGLAGNMGETQGESLSAIQTRADLTKPGVVMGTAAYMSPEQARGERADSRSDIFALGVMLHEMLAGEAPFRRQTVAETMTAILREDPPPLTVAGKPASPNLSRVLDRCLEKAPEERFQNARDLSFALENAALDSSSSLTGVQAPPGAARRPRLGISAALAVLAAGALFAAGWFLHPAAPSSVPPRVTRLTFSGSDHQPVVSSDGRLIAFTSSRNGVSQIWLRQIGGGGEQPLTEGSDWRPRFLPDSTAVSFIRNDGGRYAAYRVPVVGGQPRKVIDDVSAVAWAPDGRRLAFLRGAAFSTESRGSQLGVFDLDSGEESILMELTTWEHFGLAWSPDGRRLASVQTSLQAGAGEWRLLVIDAATGDHEKIAVRDAALISAPAWAGPSALIYAKAASTVPGSPAPNPIVRFDLTSREERTLLWEANLFPLRLSLTESTRISLLGDDRLVFDTHAQTQTVQAFDLETGVRKVLMESAATERQPAYAPDGGRVVFTSNRTGNVDLFAYEVATGAVRQLTDHPGSDWDGAFSPDGESLIWSSDRGGHLEIWMADADGSNPRQVSRDGVDAENPTMTADGQWIVYASGNSEKKGIHKVRPDGSDDSLLVAGDWVNPEVSPDGRLVLFVATDGAKLLNEIAVAEMATGEMVDFSITIRYDPQSPNITYGRGRWLPDRSAIAFIGVDREGRPAVMVQDFAPGRDTSATRRPLLAARPDLIVESFGLAPDGRSLAVSTIRQMSAIQQADDLPRLR